MAPGRRGGLGRKVPAAGTWVLGGLYGVRLADRTPCRGGGLALEQV